MFAQRLRSLRKEFKLKQIEIADKLGVAKSTIAGYEKGIRKPKQDTLKEIADIFNTSTDYLLGLTDDRTPKEPTKDLERILNSPDYHFRGKKVSNEDLKFVLQYLERVNKADINDKVEMAALEEMEDHLINKYSNNPNTPIECNESK